ncbi:MAG: ankyrin repeat domain-containing protein [Tepidisphaeraceae bacterium]|jgi:ankyrin repeat protein
MNAIQKISAAALCLVLLAGALGAWATWRWAFSPGGLVASIANHHSDFACWLVAHGVPADAKNRAGETPLMEAAVYGDLTVAESLIAHGADVNARSPQNATPLFYAVGAERDAIIRLLLEKGADPNLITTSGPILLTAATLGRQDYVTWLLAAGADIHARGPTGMTAREAAEHAHHQDIADMLARAEATTRSNETKNAIK